MTFAGVGAGADCPLGTARVGSHPVRGLSHGPYLAAPVQHAKLRAEIRPGAGVRFTVDPSEGVRWKSDTYRGTPARGRVSEFSERSRSRLRAAALDLGAFHSPDLLVTLTYPGPWRTVAPDGPACRRHLEALRKRLTRYFARLGITEWSALWFREFQRRGAPHFHLLVWGPGLSALDVRQARRWLASAWVDVVAHPDPVERQKHRKAGTGLEVYRRDHFGYAVAYATKPHQKEVPKGFPSPGRFWGLWHASVPKPAVLAVAVSLPRLVELVDRLAASIEDRSPAYAARLRANFAAVAFAGWSFSARVFGPAAVDALLGFDFGPGQPTDTSVGPPRAGASPPLHPVG